MFVFAQPPRTRPIARMVARLSSILTLSFVASTLIAQAPASSAGLADAARPTPRPANTLKQLDPADLALWKNIRYASVSPDGKWFAYQLTPNEGDAEVVVRPTGEGPERRFAIGEPPPPTGGFGGGGVNTSVVLSEDGKWLAFMTYPTAVQAKQLRKDRKPIQSGVVVVNLSTGERRDFEKVRRFVFASRRPNWLIMHRYAAEGAAPGAGADMLLLDLRSSAVTSVGNVGDFALDESGAWLAWTIEGRDLVGNGVQVRDLRADVVRVLDSDKAVYRRIAWADSGLALAVLRGRPDSAAADTSYVVLGYTGFSGQGRFKGNFLENYDAYIRNSPAFHAAKIKTPPLLLHNERDGAVDFNQGITFFNTLRELGKDVVMLQYVGENHGLQQPRNQKDYTVRMREFFDHYLKGEPAPGWLEDGIPRLKMEEHLKSRQKKKEKIAS